MEKEYFKISKLIAQYLSDKMEVDEKDLLYKWKLDSEENKNLFEKITNKNNIDNRYTKKEKYNVTDGWSRFEKKIKFKKSKQVYLKVLKYAAVIIIPLCFGVISYLYNNINRVEIIKDINPNYAKAVLNLSNGQKVLLSGDANIKLSEKDGTMISNKKMVLSYKKTKKNNDKVLINSIEVPKGNEYRVELADGTIVYLNSLSKMRYPTKFVGKTREVYISGEVYLDVAKNKDKPFIVNVNGTQIKVLGTRFNVKYFDNIIETTLEEGAVEVTNIYKEKVILKPNQQAFIDCEDNRIIKRNIDARFVTSWVRGKIIFKDQSLKSIFNELARWYDIEVECENEDVENMIFGCNINKYDSIQPVILLFEDTRRIKIDKKGKKLYIKSVE